MLDAVAVRVQQIGAGVAIGRQRLPLTLMIMLPAQTERMMHRQAQPVGADAQLVRLVIQLKARQPEPVEGFAIAPLPGHVVSWRDAPGPVQGQLAVALQQHAHQTRLQHIQAQQMAVIHLQLDKMIGVLTQRPVLQGFHNGVLIIPRCAHDVRR